MRNIAVYTSAGHRALFDIIEGHLQDAFKAQGITGPEVQDVNGPFVVENISKNTPKEDLPLFVFASYSTAMWTGAKVLAAIGSGAEVIIWVHNAEYLENLKKLKLPESVSYYLVGLPENPGDTYRKASDHLAFEIVRRLMKELKNQ